MHPRNAFLILWYLVSRLNRYESKYFVTFGQKNSKLDIVRSQSSVRKDVDEEERDENEYHSQSEEVDWCILFFVMINKHNRIAFRYVSF